MEPRHRNLAALLKASYFSKLLYLAAYSCRENTYDYHYIRKMFSKSSIHELAVHAVFYMFSVFSVENQFSFPLWIITNRLSILLNANGSHLTLCRETLYIVLLLLLPLFLSCYYCTFYATNVSIFSRTVAMRSLF